MNNNNNLEETAAAVAAAEEQSLVADSHLPFELSPLPVASPVDLRLSFTSNSDKSSSAALRLRKQSHLLHIRTHTHSADADTAVTPHNAPSQLAHTTDTTREGIVTQPPTPLPTARASEAVLCAPCVSATSAAENTHAHKALSTTVDSHHFADCQRGTCNHSLCAARANATPSAMPFHLQSYDNHLSRISMCDLAGDDDDFGHFFEDMDTPCFLPARIKHTLQPPAYNTNAQSTPRKVPGASQSVSAVPNVSGVFMDELSAAEEDSPRTSRPHKAQALSHIRTSSKAQITVSHPETHTNAHTVSPAKVEEEEKSTNEGETQREKEEEKEKAVSVDCMRPGALSRSASFSSALSTAAESESETSVLIASQWENHNARLFCRSFCERHNAHLTVNVPVCLGVCGLRILQEPYCRLYSVAEYKVKVIINNHEYCGWKRFEDFVRLAASCKRMMRFYDVASTAGSGESRKRRRGQGQLFSSSVEETEGEEVTDVSCFCSQSSQASSTFAVGNRPQGIGRHNSLTGRDGDEPDLTGTLQAWKQVEQHRPWWWFQSTATTQFAQEESLLLEEFLKNLLFEAPNMQLICELIM